MRHLPILLLPLAFVSTVRPARADELAPELERAQLRAEAQAEVANELAALAPAERKRLVGTYAAIDPDPNDPVAQVACDDDGDHVVVLSEAMLELIAHVARAISADETDGSRKVDDYAVFLARSQKPGRPLFLPPPGFYGAPPADATYDARFHEILSFVVGRELAHLRAGDLVCPKPTTTKESGDDVWTARERQKASEGASSIYPGRQAERDDAALARMIEHGRSDKGAFAFLRFFARFETEARSSGSRFVPGYVALHPDAASRASDLAKAAARASSKEDTSRVR